jgi:hypothetical protein|uniref:Uncharacterized protein n=1 Tax=viral metagenome TaxID=1070528 RepID=A0A6C0C0F9_9ZZZZ
MSLAMSYTKKSQNLKEPPSPVGRIKFMNDYKNDPIYSRILENKLTIEKSLLYQKRQKMKTEIKEEIKREINKEKEKCI